ncbi:MAG: ABC transporter substrate binding protein, partial [Pseudolabrys sp.]
QTPDTRLMMAFRQALKDAGFVEGRNVAIDYRSASGHTDRLLTLAGDLVDRRVAVIVATGGTAAANAAYAATTTIPIVFASSVDPVASGLVNSLNRPDGNATGVYVFQQVLEGKRLGLLRELVPAAALIAVLLNPTNANFQAQLGVQRQECCRVRPHRNASFGGKQRANSGHRPFQFIRQKETRAGAIS